MLPEQTFSVSAQPKNQQIWSFKLSKDLLSELESQQYQDLELDLDAGLFRKKEDGDVDIYENQDLNLVKIGHITEKITIKPSLKGSNRIKELTELEEKQKGERRALVIDEISTKKRGRKLEVKSTVLERKPSKERPPAERKARKPVAGLYKPDPELRRRLVHILASSPKNIKDLASIVKKNEHDIKLELLKIATPQVSDASTFQLKTDCYKEITPWDWDYTDGERTKVIRFAAIALDELGVPKDSPERLSLLHPEVANEKKKKLEEEKKLKDQEEQQKLLEKKLEEEKKRRERLEEKKRMELEAEKQKIEEEQKELKKLEQARKLKEAKLAQIKKDDGKASDLDANPGKTNQEQDKNFKMKRESGLLKLNIGLGTMSLEEITELYDKKYKTQMDIYQKIQQLEALTKSIEEFCIDNDSVDSEALTSKFGIEYEKPEDHYHKLESLVSDYNNVRNQLKDIKVAYMAASK